MESTSMFFPLRRYSSNRSTTGPTYGLGTDLFPWMISLVYRLTIFVLPLRSRRMLTVCGLRLYAPLAVVSMRLAVRCARYVMMPASRMTTTVTSTTLAPYLIQRSCCDSCRRTCVSDFEFSSGIFVNQRSLPATRFEHFDGQEQKHASRRN